MRMSHASMYARVVESDANCNGRFFTGVLTTGIYCLPACRARKPKAANVRFFSTCEAARAAGLRPCRKCHPDDFARGADPVLADIETLIAEMRADPAAFPDVRAVVRRSGFGTTRLFELVRQHFHSTPADMLLRARIDAAKRALVSSAQGLLEIASVVGFDSVSTFHENFRRFNGLTPAAYRELQHSNVFSIDLPEGYPVKHLRRMLGRDPQSLTERFAGDRYTCVIRLGNIPTLLTLEFKAARVDVTVAGTNPIEAHRVVTGMLGLEQDAAGFARLARKLGFARLVAERPELRLPQIPTSFDGLMWAIIGQQINLAFAFTLKRRLVERAGVPFAEGLYAPPSAADIAALDPSDLLPLQFSRQKAEYIVGVARLISEGKLDLESLRATSATRAERTLLEIRGLGPWSVHYVMMRTLGFPDCVPLGDTGVTSGLQALFKLDQRPDIDATRRLMGVFSPYRSLATAHLWQFTQLSP